MPIQLLETETKYICSMRKYCVSDYSKGPETPFQKFSFQLEVLEQPIKHLFLSSGKKIFSLSLFFFFFQAHNLGENVKERELYNKFSHQ